MSVKAAVNRRLKVIYEDDDIVVMVAPHEDELERIVLDILKRKKKGWTVREIHSYLEAIASEEKIRRTLYRLIEKKLVKQFPDGKYILEEYLKR